MKKGKSCSKRKINKMFLGGSANTLGSSLAGAMGADNTVATDVGNAAQLGVGIASGNPMDMVQGGLGLYTGGIKGTMDTFNNPYATGMEKLGSGLLTAGLGPLLGGNIAKYTFGKGASGRQQKHQDYNMGLAERNQMLGLANGGEVILRDSLNTPSAGVMLTDTLNYKPFPNASRTIVTKKKAYPKMSKEEILQQFLMEQTPDLPMQQTNTVSPTQRTGLEVVDPRMVEALKFKGKVKPAKLFADGGMLNEFNVGGTHESNVNGGIPQGYDSRGIPNTTEQDETITLPEYENDNSKFVFTARGAVTKALAQKYNLPNKMIGLTFADASKIPNEASKLRPNDIPTKNTTTAMIESLKAANTDWKNTKEANTMAKGGMLNQYVDGGEELNNKLPYGEGKGFKRWMPSSGYDDYTKWLGDRFNPNDPVKLKEFNSVFDPTNPMNQTPERQGWIKTIQQTNPSLLTNSSELMRLSKDGKMGPVHSLIADWGGSNHVKDTPGFGDPLKRRETDLTSSIDSGLTVKTIPTTPTEFKEKKEFPNLWPEAGMLAGMIPLPKNIRANATTISSGLLDPNLVDEQTMRANIDAANRGNIGALSNVTGGSGAAQRASMLGTGANYMDATGNAFLQANQANNAARQQANQFNIQNQGNIAGQNQQALNQFDLFNTQNENARNLEQFDTRLGAFQDYTMNANDRMQSNQNREFLTKALQYDPKTGNYNSTADGGMILTKRRSIK